jgi:hypothetical protein
MERGAVERALQELAECQAEASDARRFAHADRAAEDLATVVEPVTSAKDIGGSAPAKDNINNNTSRGKKKKKVGGGGGGEGGRGKGRGTGREAGDEARAMAK